MINKIIQSPSIQMNRPWWMPFVSLLITLHGILWLHWDLQPIVFLFWWEVILMLGAALIRMLFALDNQPFLNTLFSKIGLLFGGLIMAGAFIMLTVTFTFKAFEGGSFTGLGNIHYQTNMMTAGYAIGLALHYFMNGRYKTASPFGELMLPFVHLLILLGLLQVLTMHLIPTYPELNQAVWVAVALVVLKFIIDLLFSKINQPVKALFDKNQTEID
jgi:Family of unknown function (DUF6498)